MPNGSVMWKNGPSVECGELGRMLQELHNDILNDVDTKLQRNIDRIVAELEAKHRKTQTGFLEKSSPAKKSGRPKELLTKEFALRNSVLANRWENPDLRSLYNCILAVIVLMAIYITIFYYFNVERFKRDIAVVGWTFGQFHIVIASWLGINLSIVFILYPAFRFWATNRTLVKKKGLYDSMFCTLFILYEVTLLIIPAKVILAYDLPPTSSVIIAAEQIRLFLKCYAFVRENIPRTLNYKPHQDGNREDSDSNLCPEVEKLVYFLFAPTMVYRNHYPRTTRIRWDYIAWYSLQIVYGLLAYYIIFIWFSVNTFKKAGIEPMTLAEFISALIRSIFAAGAAMLFAFFGLLYWIPEIFAEVLRFGDRRFFEDWWNCTSYAEFFRSWNLIMQDFIYCYIYPDMCVVWGRSSKMAVLTVFMISAVVHEYILVVVCKCLFPLFFIGFAIVGVPLVFITRNKTSRPWNVFLWFTLLQGYGIMFVFYTVEWYARINCPRIIDSWQDFFVPRSFYCNVISWPS